MEKTLKKKILVICIFSLIPILAQRPISQRVDCAPDQTAITVQACQDRGCIFDSITEDDELGGAPRFEKRNFNNVLLSMIHSKDAFSAMTMVSS